MYQGMRNSTLGVFPGDQTNSTSLVKQAKPQQTETMEVCHKSNNQAEKLDGPFTSWSYASLMNISTFETGTQHGFPSASHRTLEQTPQFEADLP